MCVHVSDTCTIISSYTKITHLMTVPCFIPMLHISVSAFVKNIFRDIMRLNIHTTSVVIKYTP